MASTSDVYNLNDELKKEKEQQDNNLNAAYSNQLYGTNNNAATVGASSDAAASDYSNYLTAQNQNLYTQAQSDNTAANQTQNNAATTPATQSTENSNSSQNTANAAATPATPAENAVTTASTTPTATVDYSSLSKYDQTLSDDAKNQILQYKQEWRDAQAKNDTAAMKEAYLQAQLVRAKYGGYIDNSGDGTGYQNFGYGNLSLPDQKLPSDAQNEILYWKLQYMNADNDTDKQYAQQMANAVRSKYGNYTSTDGSDYVQNTVGVNSQYAYNGGNYTNPYSDKITALTNDLNDNKGWDASSYNPSTDPAYQAYVDYYTRNGDAAASQAMAQAAGNTGGIANSYATALAAAAQQSYAKQLTDIIPTLETNAQTAYNNNITNKEALLSQLESMNNDAYNQYSTNRTFDYNTWLQNYQNAYNLYNMNNTNNQNAIDRNWQTQQNQLDRDEDRYLASLK